MDNRGFLAITVILVAVIAVSYFFQPKPATGQQTPAAQSAVATPAAPAPPQEIQAPSKSITVSTPKYVAVFNERGGRLASFKLLGYNKRKLNPALSDEAMELITMSNRDDWPLRLSLSSANNVAAPSLENAHFVADVDQLTVGEGESRQLSMTYQAPDGVTVTRLFTFSSDSYLVKQLVTVENKSEVPLSDLMLTMRINTAPFSDGKPGRYDQMAAYINGKMITEAPKDAASKLGDYRGKLKSVDWIGYMDQYFLTALVMPDITDVPGAVPPSLLAVLQDHGGVAVGASQPLNLASGQKAAYDFAFYYGPKSNNDLKAAGHNLTKSVDLGWFSFIAAPLAALLRWLYSIIGNYGLAIIIVTILIKVALWPLTAKSYRSMKDMQKLQPKVLKIREKYADDKEAMNREIMQLYKTFKINPLGGCLPMVLQIPFFIAFYRVLDSLLELRGAPFILWIKDLAAPDRLFSFDFTIPFFEPPTGIPVLTILMGASMVLQQKMTPNTMGDPMQAKMMMMMPIVFTFILINMPAGLVLYWLVNNILSIGQQLLINRPKQQAA